MHDKQKVIVGIAVFLAIVLFPVWFSLARGGSGAKADPELPRRDDPKLAGELWKTERCVAETEVVRATHMEILNDWRDSVVREGRRMIRVEGLPRPIEMSLSRACLDCHTSKARFCDSCHDYAGVKPYCWDCHLVPEGRE